MFSLSPEREQIGRLQELCMQAEHAYYAYSEEQCDISEFAAVMSKIQDELKIAEKLWGTNPPATKEIDPLLKRIKILHDLLSFNMHQYKEILKIFHSVLPSADKTPLLCVNKDWNAAFTAIQEIDTHEQITAQLPSLATDLAVLDTHLDAPLDTESASTIRALIRESQEILKIFRNAHFSGQNWNVLDLEDLEGEIKDVLASALKNLGPETSVALFSSIEKKCTPTFFQDLKTLTQCYKEIDASANPQKARADAIPTLASVKAFHKIHSWILANELSGYQQQGCEVLLSRLTKTGRYEKVFEILRMLVENPQQLHITPAERQAVHASLILTPIEILCEQNRFNKAFEALQIPLTKYSENPATEEEWDTNNLISDGFDVIVGSLSDNGFSKEATDIALKHPSVIDHTELLLTIVDKSPLVEKKKFTELAELARLLKIELHKCPRHEPFLVEGWIRYALLIAKTPRAFLRSAGINKTGALEIAFTAINSLNKELQKKLPQILDEIPAEETEIRQRIQALLSTFPQA